LFPAPASCAGLIPISRTWVHFTVVVASSTLSDPSPEEWILKKENEEQIFCKQQESLYIREPCIHLVWYELTNNG
jgi:hypothetical protein